MKDRKADSPIRQVRIRAYMQSPVVCDPFLPLDGVMYYHATRDMMGAQVMSTPGRSAVAEAKGVVLPFIKLNRDNDAWFYACSFAQWPEHTREDESFYVKRFDQHLSDLVDTSKRGKVELRKGRYKNYHNSLYMRVALYVDWYGIGDPGRIEDLLRFCSHIGKKTSQGYGSVLRWEVMEWPEDWSVRGPGGKLMRAVPMIKPGIQYGLRPSYWNPKHQFNCKMPDMP